METESAIKDWRTKTNEFVSTGADRQTERQKLTTIPSAPSPVVAVAVVAVLVTLVKHNTTGCVPPSRLPPEGSCYSGTFQKGLAQAPGGFQEASRSSGASERLQQLLEASGWTPTMSWADPLLTPKRMADGYIVCYNLPPPPPSSLCLHRLGSGMLQSRGVSISIPRWSADLYPAAACGGHF